MAKNYLVKKGRRPRNANRRKSKPISPSKERYQHNKNKNMLDDMIEHSTEDNEKLIAFLNK